MTGVEWWVTHEGLMGWLTRFALIRWVLAFPFLQGRIRYRDVLTYRWSGSKR